MVRATRVMVVTAGVQAGSGSGIFSFDTPSKSLVKHANTPATGAARLTLMGARFGSLSYTSALRHTGVQASAAESTVWTSDTAMCARSVAGLSYTRRVSLTAGERCSSVSEAYSFDSALQIRSERGWNGAVWPALNMNMTHGPSSGTNENASALARLDQTTRATPTHVNKTLYSVAMRNAASTGMSET